MRSASPFQSIEGFFGRGGAPLVKLLIVSNVVSLFLSVFGGGAKLAQMLAFTTPAALRAPWTLVTYPFVAFDALSVLFGGIWIWTVGGSLERAWGARSFALFFACLSAVSALSLTVGAQLVGAIAFAAGLWLPLAGVTVAFALINWNLELSFWGIPCRVQHLMWIVLGLTFLNFAQASGSPMVGLFSLGGSGFAYAQLRWFRLGLYKPTHTVGWRGRQIELEPLPSAQRARTRNPFETFARWKRKRDFARLMKQSGLDDEIKPKG